MKSACERCGRILQANAEARVCPHDCTFCAECAVALNGRCPNCGGALHVRT